MTGSLTQGTAMNQESVVDADPQIVPSEPDQG